jgi:hypothetical protein
MTVARLARKCKPVGTKSGTATSPDLTRANRYDVVPASGQLARADEAIA